MDKNDLASHLTTKEALDVIEKNHINPNIKGDDFNDLRTSIENNQINAIGTAGNARRILGRIFITAAAFCLAQVIGLLVKHFKS